MAKRVNIKQLKEESDGIIYYIVPNAKSLLKAGYIYCDYLLKKEDIDSVYEDLLIDYSVFGNELDVMIGYCKETKEVYDAFINDYCQEFDKTNEEIQNQIKDSVKVSKNEKGKNTSSYQTVLYHGNIFKCRQTEFKEYFIESANNIGCVLKFVKYSKEEVKETKKDVKPKNVRIKKQKETKEDVKKDVKEDVKDNVTVNKKETKELDNKSNENKPDDKVKEDIKVDLVKKKTTKSKVSRKPKQIIDDDLITDEPTGGTVKEVKEDKEVVKDEKNEIKKVKETKQKPSDQPKKVSLSHKPIGLDDELIDDNDEVEDDSDFEEINNAPTLNC